MQMPNACDNHDSDSHCRFWRIGYQRWNCVSVELHVFLCLGLELFCLPSFWRCCKHLWFLGNISAYYKWKPDYYKHSSSSGPELCIFWDAPLPRCTIHFWNSSSRGYNGIGRHLCPARLICCMLLSLTQNSSFCIVQGPNRKILCGFFLSEHQVTPPQQFLNVPNLHSI